MLQTLILLQIEWVKGLLAVPFVLHSQPTAVFEPRRESVDQMATGAHRRYAEIMRDVEELINDHSQFPSSQLGLTLQTIPDSGQSPTKKPAPMRTPN